MLIHHYHPQSGVYLGASQAEPDPLELQLARNRASGPILAAAHSVYAARVEELEALKSDCRTACDQAMDAARATLDEKSALLSATLATASTVRDALIADANAAFEEEVERGTAIATASSTRDQAIAAAQTTYDQQVADGDLQLAAIRAECDQALLSEQDLLATEENKIDAWLSEASEALKTEWAAGQAASAAVVADVWLVPAHSTMEQPPAFGIDELAIWTDGAWSIIPAPEPLEEEPAPSPDLATTARMERDRRINSVRWLIDRHRDEQALGRTTTLTAEDYQLVLQHVQDLRDVPEQDTFPDAIDWPILPPELLTTGA